MWVVFVFGGIVVSAFMAVKTGKEEREIENKGIEREGEEYMKRLAKEKERRHGKNEEKVFEN
ncbi:sporulation YhaL family protein [Niallia sp. 03133]|uniref:sporulation YhaL family protein n=1 Tax=Niallia sp. 03133 TaxID=3458060 RepID=UPI004044F4C1